MIVRLKAFNFSYILCEVLSFQFYDSPIKRIDAGKKSILVFSFNSMIVRLKEHRRRGFPEAKNRFNSMIVRLKACMHIKDSLAIASFNSMIVRLKVRVYMLIQRM